MEQPHPSVHAISVLPATPHLFHPDMVIFRPMLTLNRTDTWTPSLARQESNLCSAARDYSLTPAAVAGTPAPAQFCYKRQRRVVALQCLARSNPKQETRVVSKRRKGPSVISTKHRRTKYQSMAHAPYGAQLTLPQYAARCNRTRNTMTKAQPERTPPGTTRSSRVRVLIHA